MNQHMKFFLTWLLLLCAAGAHAATASKPIGQIVDVYGDRTNQLIGYGLVVGLDGTGDKSQVKFTQQSIVNMIKQFGVQLDDKANPKLKNVAAVSVTAEIGTNMGPGQTMHVTVSSLGDAKSLRGGTLLMTPLHGADGEVYGIAQGNVVVGGFSATGADGSSITKNTTTAGRIPNGATLEKEIVVEHDEPVLRLNLKRPNYKTALNISRKINSVFGGSVAVAKNKNRVEVTAPQDTEQRVLFVSMIEELQVVEGAGLPKVVFNSRTGTVVISSTVTVSEAAVSQGGLTIAVKETQQVSQPNAFSQGETTKVNDSNLKVTEENPTMMIWEKGTNLQEIVDAVNRVGATPDALMQILQALDEAGALSGQLVVI